MGQRVKTSGNLSVEYGVSATADGTFANYVWVGLASGRYFSRLTNDEVTAMNAVPLGWTRKNKAHWQLCDAAPRLPQSIDYYQEPIQGIVAINGVINHSFNSGWKLGELRVLGATNLAGQTFPLVYTYEQFKPKLNGASSNEVESQFLVTVNVRTIRLEAVPEVLTPKMAGATEVYDHRFADGSSHQGEVSALFLSGHPIDGPGMYQTTAERLPEKVDVAAIEQFNQQFTFASTTPNQRPVTAERFSKAKWIWPPAILIIMAVVVRAGWMKRKHGNQA